MESRNVENDFDNLVEEIDKIEILATKLLKDTKKLTFLIEGLENHEKNCVVHLMKSPLTSESRLGDAGLRRTVQSWNNSTKDLEIANKNLEGGFKKSVRDPIKEYLKVLSNCHSSLGKRQTALQEQAKALGRWRKIEKEGKFSVTTAKLNDIVIQLAEADHLVDALDSVLRRNLHKILNDSGQLLDPILINLSISQMQNHRSTYTILNNFVRTTNPNIEISESSLEAQMKSLNNQLESLSIVKGNILPKE